MDVALAKVFQVLKEGNSVWTTALNSVATHCIWSELELVVDNVPAELPAPPAKTSGKYHCTRNHGYTHTHIHLKCCVFISCNKKKQY